MNNKLLKLIEIIAAVLLILSFMIACNNKDKQTEDLVLNSKNEVLSGTYNKCWKECKPDICEGLETDENTSCCKTVFFSDHRIEVFNKGLLDKTGIWCFNSDSTELEVQFGNEFSIFNIMELSDKKFHYTCIRSKDTLEAIFVPES